MSRAVLVGRVWRNDGPTVVAVRNGDVFDIGAHAPTMADLLERDDALDIARSAPGEPLGTVHQLLADAIAGSTGAAAGAPQLLAP